MFGKKERKRISLRRDYIGDYIGYLDNAALRTLMGAREIRPSLGLRSDRTLGALIARVFGLRRRGWLFPPSSLSSALSPGKQTQVIYADNITKYDRRYKPQSRTLLVTPKDVNIIAYEKLTEGPNKGKEMHVFKRQINITTIKSISVRLVDGVGVRARERHRGT